MYLYTHSNVFIFDLNAYNYIPTIMHLFHDLNAYKFYTYLNVLVFDLNAYIYISIVKYLGL